MLNCQRLLYSTLLSLALCSTAILVHGQARARSAKGKTTDHSLRSDSLEPDARRNPILLSVRNGAVVPADLIGPDPLDSDAVVVEVEGLRRSLKIEDVRIRSQATKFDEYGKLASNDEKARLDNFAINLQNDPTSTGYIIVYGSCLDESRARGKSARNYLVNTRGLDPSKATTLDGGCRRDFAVELWICPSGAPTPTTSAEGRLNPCPKCKKSSRKSRRKHK